MAKTATLAAAFQQFDTYPSNPRWSWTAVSSDQKTVAVTLWEDQINPDGSVNFFGHEELERWQAKPGNMERIRNLKIAQANCGGRFHVVVVKARDTKEFPRQIIDRYPADYMMQLVDLDEETGEFKAERA